jgi:saccharopine dehydrogenase-like NADP-dependent oxidoreductase
MEKNKILIIGGYGQVGKYVTLELLKKFPSEIIVAGRDLNKANSFAKQYSNSFETLKLDIYNIENIPHLIKDIKIAVMCLSPKNNDFAKYCIENGIHYIDISPSNDIVKNIENCANKKSTCVLGVGLAPGLSNLLVKKICQEMDILQDVNISLMLGVGEAHGNDGIKWLLDNIRTDFFVRNKRIKPFVKGKKTVFIQDLGERKVYPFNLADQFIIPKTLNIENVSSYFCYDSKFITNYVSVLKHIGIFGLLKFDFMYKIIFRLFISILNVIQKLKLGTDVYSIKVDANGIKNGKKYICRTGIIGNNNSLLTAKITSFVAKKLYMENYPLGIFYLEELFSLEELDIYSICPEMEIIENNGSKREN